MQKNKILKRIDRIIFQAIVMGDNLTADDVLRLGNHARFKEKLVQFCEYIHSRQLLLYQ